MTSVDKELNIYLDLGDKYTLPPSGKDVKIGANPLDYATKLNSIDSPSQRVFEFLKNYVDFTETNISLEASTVRMMTFVGVVGGVTYGTILNSQNIRERFIRKHNKAAFDSQHLAQRKYYDYLVSRSLSRGFKYGIQGALLTGSVGIVSFSSMIYRDRIYPPDWFIGYAICGALSRFMLGPKAWLFGAGAGAVAAIFGLATAKGIEYVSGQSIAQIRYLNHTDWLSKRVKTYEMIMLRKEKSIQEKYEKMQAGGDNGGAF